MSVRRGHDKPPTYAGNASSLPVLNVTIPKAEGVDENEYRTEVLNQWFIPLVSIASLANIIADIIVGICIVLLEDFTGWKMINSDHTSFITLLLSVTMGLQLGEHKRRYDEVTEHFGIITCNESGVFEEDIRKGVISIILRMPVGEVMTPQQFYSIYVGIQSTIYPLEEKYKAYRAICNTVTNSNAKILNKLIWWHINLLCAIMIPSSMNDNERRGDFGWLVAAILIMIMAWSTYGIIVQYTDVLRPTRVWIYSNLRPKIKHARAKGFFEKMAVVF